MAIRTVIHSGQQSIERVLQTGLPTLLVFWRRQALTSDQDAVLDALAAQYAGRALVVKLDADAEQPLLTRFGVSSVPALVVTKGAQVETRLTGATATADAAAWLKHLIDGGPRPQAHSPAAGSAPRPTGDGKPVTLTDASFQQAIQGAQPVLVDFWAPWCGPCRMVAPAVEELAREFSGRAVVAKLNVDENPATAQHFGIQGIPALFIFKQGRVVERMVGVQPAATLRAKLAQHVN